MSTCRRAIVLQEDADDGELLTDLLAVFLGFGVFMANAVLGPRVFLGLVEGLSDDEYAYALGILASFLATWVNRPGQASCAPMSANRCWKQSVGWPKLTRRRYSARPSLRAAGRNHTAFAASRSGPF